MFLRLLAIGLTALVMTLRLPGAPSATNDAAAIVDSGSTNRPGFRIVIDRSGVAEFTSMPRRLAGLSDKSGPARITVPRALTERFYADLKAASPLSSLPAVHCMKSVSFGSTLTVRMGGEQTPDLSCGDGGSAVMGSLIHDVDEIVALFRVK